MPESSQSTFSMLDFSFKYTFLHPHSKKSTWIVSDMPHLEKKLVSSLELSSVNKSKLNLIQKSCPLYLKIIADVWRVTRVSDSHLFMDTRLTKNHCNKDRFFRMNVSLSVQVLSASTCNMIQTTIADDNVMQNIRLDFDRHNDTLNLVSKENLLVETRNGAFFGSNNFTKFAPENATQGIEEHLCMLVWFNYWKVIVFSKYENKRMNSY